MVYFIFLALHTILFCLIANMINITLPFVFLILGTLIFSIIVIFHFERPIILLYHLVFSIVFQNTLIGLGNNITNYQTDGTNVKLLLIYKEVFAAIVLLLLFLKYVKKFKLIKFEIVAPLLILVIAISFIMSTGGNFENKLFYTRQYLVVFLSYFTGRLIYFGIKNRYSDIVNLLKFVIWLGLLSVLWGFIFFFIGHDSMLWDTWFNIAIINESKGYSGELNNWKSIVGDHIVPRLFSIFFDSITLSYFILVSICCTLLLRNNFSVKVLRFFLIIGLIFTLGKGAMSILIILLTWIFLINILKIKPKFFVPPLIIVMVIIFIEAYNSGFKSSAIVHFEGFVQPLLNSPQYPFGNGIGTGGVYYAMLMGLRAFEASHLGTESFFGSLIYQLGYPGLILYLLFFTGSIRYLLKNNHKENPMRYKSILLSGIMFALMIAALFQEASLGINYTGILTILVGFFISKTFHENET